MEVFDIKMTVPFLAQHSEYPLNKCRTRRASRTCVKQQNSARMNYYNAWHTEKGAMFHSLKSVPGYGNYSLAHVSTWVYFFTICFSKHYFAIINSYNLALIRIQVATACCHHSTKE